MKYIEQELCVFIPHTHEEKCQRVPKCIG